MSWFICYCFRFLLLVVVCFVLFYIVVFNGLFLYGLIKFIYIFVLFLVNRDCLYFVYMKYDRVLWKCKKLYLF